MRTRPLCEPSVLGKRYTNFVQKTMVIFIKKVSLRSGWDAGSETVVGQYRYSGFGQNPTSEGRIAREILWMSNLTYAY